MDDAQVCNSTPTPLPSTIEPIDRAGACLGVEHNLAAYQHTRSCFPIDHTILNALLQVEALWIPQ